MLADIQVTLNNRDSQNKRRLHDCMLSAFALDKIEKNTVSLEHIKAQVGQANVSFF